MARVAFLAPSRVVETSRNYSYERSKQRRGGCDRWIISMDEKSQRKRKIGMKDLEAETGMDVIVSWEDTLQTE